ncbi:hypothetical protein ACFQS2_00835 [Brachybacterium sp. GCM10030267]|uniref:hypothetical protein n=1 Tax=Brachybacterium sp. GCM10030267 TaxID=3273381 RepID=UPI003619DB8C
MNTTEQQDALRSRWTLEGTIPLAGVADGAAWHRARSVATGESVTLFIVRGPAALEAADAVRRAYLVEDPHLVPVRDIVVLEGSDENPGDAGPARAAEGTGGVDGEARTGEGPTGEGPMTIVEYPPPPAPPLAALLGKGPLHPETARSIIGEAATGLEVARRRGVRHQFLDSNRVFVDTASGEVSVLGVGVEAAAHTNLDRSREVASFQDTAALVALLYRALTGRSPQHDASGTVPRPSSIVDTEIPADLDLLCDLVLNETADDIPETTRGLIAALEPWQSIPVTLEAYPRGSRPAGPSQQHGEPGRTDERGEPDKPSVTDERGEPVEPSHPVEPSEPVEPDEDTVVRPAGPGTEAHSAAGPTTAGALAAAGAVGAATSQTTPPGSTPGPVPPVDTARDQAPSAAASAPAAEPAVAAARGAAPGPAGAAKPEDTTKPVDTAEPAKTEETAQTSAEARGLVEDLHLDEKRSSSPFPGQLDITPPRPTTPAAPEPQEAPAASDRTQPSEPSHSAHAPQSGSPEQSSAPAAAGAGAVAAGGVAAGSQSVDPGIPARTAGTQWPLTPVHDAEAADPLSPSQAPEHSTAPPEQPRRTSPEHPDASGVSDTQTPQQDEDAAADEAATPTSAGPVHHTPSAGSPAPMAVSGRTESLAPVVSDGPIVVRGRDRSALEDPPEEATVPSGRGTLFRDVVGIAVDADDPETYALGPTQAEERSRQSQWILIGGVLVVIVALVFALTTVTSGLRERMANPLDTSPVASPTETETDEAPVEPTQDTEEPELPAAQIGDIELFAQGTDQPPDNADQQERITDGDPGTFWSTKYYASPDYGGLKDGVGVRVNLVEQSKLSAVTVTTARNSGGTLELRAVNDDGSPGDVLASGEFAGDGEVRLEPGEPVETDQVILWPSDLPPDSEESGKFRARIAEIRVE